MDQLRDYFLSEIFTWVFGGGWRSMVGALIVGAGWVWFWKKHPRWAVAALGGITFAALLMAIQVGFKTQKFFEQQRAAVQRLENSHKPLVTAENVTSFIELWSRNLRMPFKLATDPNTIWLYEITLPPGQRVAVSRDKTQDQYVSIDASLRVNPNTGAVLSNLSVREMNELERKISTELVRMGLQYYLDKWPEMVTVRTTIPIHGLTEFGFAEALSATNGARILVINTVADALDSPAKR